MVISQKDKKFRDSSKKGAHFEDLAAALKAWESTLNHDPSSEAFYLWNCESLKTGS